MLTSNNFSKGLSTDTLEKYQPDGTYRFALNAVLETEEGELAAISNEKGNYLCAQGYPSDKIVIGHVNLNDGTVALFLYDPDPNRPDHEIGIFNGDSCTYTTLIKGSCLNFSDRYPINAIYRLKNGCDRLIYFTDNYNTYRVVNIDKTEIYTGPDNTSILPEGCPKLMFYREHYTPNFEDPIIRDSGGRLKNGLYYFAIRYLDEQLTPTNWLLVSNPVAIADEKYRLTENYETTSFYDGGANTPEAPGYTQPSTKSITLTVTRADTTFKYAQIAAIKRTLDADGIESVDVLFPIPIVETGISLTDIEFTYTGEDSQVQYQTSVEDILSEKVKVNLVTAQSIKDNTLFIANLTEQQPSYIGFQRHASSIKTEYVREFNFVDDDNEGFIEPSKKEEFYFKKGSFLHDEVYSLGIVYIWKNGDTSPVFTIPGRSVINNTGTTFGTNPQFTGNESNWDTFNVGPFDPNTFNTNKTLRWQVYNTFTKKTFSTGLMGYYETAQPYPLIDLECDNHPDGYWGRDWQGNLIQGGITKIRHHRMPPMMVGDAAMVNQYPKLGIRFTMVQDYPHPDIIGHYYVFGDRTLDKTIVDKGIFLPLSDYGSDNLAFYETKLSYGGHQLGQTYGFISPKILFEDNYTSGDYVTVERSGGSIYTSQGFPVDEDISGSVVNDLYGAVLTIFGGARQYSAWETPLGYNYSILDDAFLAKTPLTNADKVPSYVYSSIAGKPIQNNSINNNIAVISLSKEINEAAGTLGTGYWIGKNQVYASIKSDKDVFSNLYSINYTRINSEHLQKSENITLVADLYNGDIFTYNLNIVDFRWVQTQSQITIRPFFISVFLESEINSAFRHGDKSKPDLYNYYQFPYRDDGSKFRDYISLKYYEVEAGKALFRPESYLLNKSYNNTNSIQRYYPVSFDFDFCNSCYNNYPYRIYHSESDDAEVGEDRLRKILPNNYIDIDGNTGEITDLFTSLNDLYCTSLYSAYLIPTNVQRLTTLDNTEVYLGKASTLQLPPRQLKNSTSALGGSRSFTGRTTTEFGVFYADAISGRAFLLNKELKDLSLSGLRNFFEAEGVFYIDSQFRRKFSQPYPTNSPISDFPCGYTTTYDPRTKRILVTKKDFAVREDKLQSLVYTPTNNTPNAFWFDGINFYVNNGSGVKSKLDLDNNTYFQNKSFTLSYSFLNDCWVSFHSYLPKYMFNDNNTFYSNSIYKHDSLQFQTYYGGKFDHILEVTAKYAPFMQNTLSNIYYNSTTKFYNQNTMQYVPYNKTFDRIAVYNSSQSTGIQDLQLKPVMTITPPSDGILEVKKTDKQWRISELRDYVTDPNQALWDLSLPVANKNVFFTNKSPNISNLDINKSGYELKRFKDHFANIRLYFKPNENLKISTDLVQTVYANRNR